jgi:integrase
VNLEQGWVRLWTRKRRGGELEGDILPVGAEVLNVLKRRWQNRDSETSKVFPELEDLSHNKTYRIMARLCGRAGVKPFGFHAIRHHVASILQDSGKATTTQIQKFLRHRRRTTTEAYLHMIDRTLVDLPGILETNFGDQSGAKTAFCPIASGQE